MTTEALRDELHVPKGSVIFRQGDPGHEMFVVSAGRVGLTIGSEGHEKEVALLGTGEFFGELSLLSEAPRSATATAVEDSTLLVISRDVFAMMVQDDLEIVFRMMNIQGQRLSNTNVPIQDYVQRLGRIRIATHCLRCFLKSSQMPASVEFAGLATELGLSAQAVEATIEDLVEQGIGSRRDSRWSVENREQLDTLLDIVCRFATVPMP